MLTIIYSKRINKQDFYFGGRKVSIGDISNGQSLAWTPAPVGVFLLSNLTGFKLIRNGFINRHLFISAGTQTALYLCYISAPV